MFAPTVSIRPTLKDLQHWITPQYAPCWRELGIQLGVTNETLSIIQEDSPHSVTKRCNAMLTKWLEVDDTSASWRKLFTAIDNSTYQRLNDNQDNTGNFNYFISGSIQSGVLTPVTVA